MSHIPNHRLKFMAGALAAVVAALMLTTVSSEASHDETTEATREDVSLEKVSFEEIMKEEVDRAARSCVEDHGFTYYSDGAEAAAKLPADRLAEYEEILLGSPGEAGCIERALQVGDAMSTAYMKAVETNSLFFADVEESRDYQKAAAVWSACMSENGHEISNPKEVEGLRNGLVAKSDRITVIEPPSTPGPGTEYEDAGPPPSPEEVEAWVSSRDAAIGDLLKIGEDIESLDASVETCQISSGLASIQAEGHTSFLEYLAKSDPNSYEAIVGGSR